MTEQGFPKVCGQTAYTFRVDLSAEEAAKTVAVSVESLDAAELFVNGVSAGVRLWAPYRFDTAGLFRAGENSIEVRLTLPMHNLWCTSGEEIAMGLLAAPKLECNA